MKKLICGLLVLAALCGPSALAEDAETAPSLWPACDPVTGLWGYITKDGAWGIAPQYTGASHFHGGCAIVDMAEPAHADTSAQGIIDENGEFLLEAAYMVFDFCDMGKTGIYFVMDDEGDMGWFNLENRFFSGVIWTECYATKDTPYVMVYVGYELGGLADRETGKVVLPLEYSYTGLYDWGIEDGFLVAEGADDDGCELIEISVGPVELPEGVYLDYVVEVSDGLVVYTNEDGLYGYISTAGEIVIPAQFDAAHDFRDGYAEVGLLEEVRTSAVIDHSGKVVISGLDAYYGMCAGALFVEWPDDSWGLVETDGTIRCRHTLPEEAFEVFWLYEVTEDGPIWVEYALGDDEYAWGLMSRAGELLGDRLWQADGAGLSGDEWQVVGLDGKWGYADAYGDAVLPFIYDAAWPFEGALARVQLDETTQGYISRAGEIVYQWPVTDDEW